MENNNVALNLGLIEVEAAPARAFAGFAGRVHPTEKAAIVDLASNKLAQIWLSKARTEGDGSFLKFMDLLSLDLELSEAALKLARFKAA